MNIKIFNVIRTQLNNNTSLWSFPTFLQAKEKMFKKAAKEIGVNESAFSIENEHFALNGYDVWKGDDYITISDGNKVEYEIKQTTMETYQLQVERIIDKVMAVYPDCENYREMIFDVLLSYTEKDLPFYDEEIGHFVYTELEEKFAKRAAGMIVSGYDNDFQDKYFQVVADYLEGNRGLSVMLAIINDEEDAIEDVKREINKEQGKVVFNMDYVWVCTSEWKDDTNFDYCENTSVYRSHESAVAAMDKAYNEVIEVFNGQYIGEEVTYWCDDDVYQVSFADDSRHDMWEGRISKIYIQD